MVDGQAPGAAEPTGRPSGRGRRASIGDQALTRVVNPVVHAALRSPLHDLMSDHVLVMGFTAG
jgi:hypothetical protein